MNKLISSIAIFILILTLLSLWFYPLTSQKLGIISFLSTLSLSIYPIIQKHKGTEHARAKILKEVGVMVLTLIIILFLGGIAAMLANAQVSVRWGAMAGFVSAITASFAVGYLVRKGMGRLVR